MITTTRLGLRDFSMLIALLAIALCFWAADPAFLSARNLSQLSIEVAATAVLALGMLLIIVPGHIDLSVGSGLGLMGGVAAVLVVQQQFAAPAAMLLAVLLSIALYAAMGALIVRERIPAFIITLGGLLVFKGVHWLVIGSETVPVVRGGQSNLYSILTTWYVPPAWGFVLAALLAALLGLSAWWNHRRRRDRGLPTDAEGAFLRWFVAAQLLLLVVLVLNPYRGVPLSLLILAATAFIVHVICQHLRLGRYLFAIGGNEETALVSGVPTGRVVIAAFAIMGVIVALAGFLQTAFASASTTTTGQLMELDADR